MLRGIFSKYASPIALATGLIVSSVSAQASDQPQSMVDTKPAGADSPVDAISKPSEAPLSRWLTLDEFNFGMRYRNSASAAGGRNFDGAQQRSLVSGKFKLDKEGKYAIGFRASSGRYFNWAYANFAGIGLPSTRYRAVTTDPLFFRFLISQGKDSFIGPVSRGWEFYMRELYFSATPMEQLTFEFGGLGIEHGAATEVTTFDDDGYISGERVRLHDKSHFYFDEVSATFGYLGDVSVPNFFPRANRLAENNYRQVLAQKKFGSRVSASVGYDWIHGLSTMREAGTVKISESKVLDSAHVELYQRTSDAQLGPSPLSLFSSGNGWSIAGTKQLAKKKWQLQGGYADIDRHYGVYSDSRSATTFGFSLNGDAYQIGKRVFVRANYSPSKEFTMFSFYTHEVDTPTDHLYNAFNHQTWQAGATINFKGFLEKYGLL